LLPEFKQQNKVLQDITEAITFFDIL